MNAAGKKHVPVTGHSNSIDGPAAGTPAREAISMLVDRCGPTLHALALRLCGHRADAEDLVQEVFLQAFRRWETFRGEADPSTWVYAIAARSCKARSRRKGGVDRRAPAISQLMPWGEETVMQIAAAQDAGADSAGRREAIDRVQSEIAKLPEHLLLPLVLKEIMGLSVADVGGALGLVANTVKTRLHRARLELRQAMRSRGGSVKAPPPIYERQVCMVLLKAKMEAMDRGGTLEGFGVPRAELCERCRAVFRELDLVQDACVAFGSGPIPPRVRASILRAMDNAADDGAAPSPVRRGRRPVAGSKGRGTSRGA
jgi:RNA polymerase sigma-70 factor, ECF subfamily